MASALLPFGLRVLGEANCHCHEDVESYGEATWPGNGGSCPQPCECAILEGHLPAPFKPSGEHSPRWHPAWKLVRDPEPEQPS